MGYLIISLLFAVTQSCAGVEARLGCGLASKATKEEQLWALICTLVSVVKATACVG